MRKRCQLEWRLHDRAPAIPCRRIGRSVGRSLAGCKWWSWSVVLDGVFNPYAFRKNEPGADERLCADAPTLDDHELVARELTTTEDAIFQVLFRRMRVASAAEFWRSARWPVANFGNSKFVPVKLELRPPCEVIPQRFSSRFRLGSIYGQSWKN